MTKRKASELTKAELLEMVTKLRGVLSDAVDDHDVDVSAMRYEVVRVMAETAFEDDHADIVSRLRDIHALAQAMEGDCSHLEEAAQEIEKLRDFQKAKEKTVGGLKAELQEVERERDRMVVVLRKIDDWADYMGGFEIQRDVRKVLRRYDEGKDSTKS